MKKLIVVIVSVVMGLLALLPTVEANGRKGDSVVPAWKREVFRRPELTYLFKACLHFSAHNLFQKGRVDFSDQADVMKRCPLFGERFKWYEDHKDATGEWVLHHASFNLWCVYTPACLRVVKPKVVNLANKDEKASAGDQRDMKPLANSGVEQPKKKAAPAEPPWPRTAAEKNAAAEKMTAALLAGPTPTVAETKPAPSTPDVTIMEDDEPAAPPAVVEPALDRKAREARAKAVIALKAAGSDQKKRKVAEPVVQKAIKATCKAVAANPTGYSASQRSICSEEIAVAKKAKQPRPRITRIVARNIINVPECPACPPAAPATVQKGTSFWKIVLGTLAGGAVIALGSWGAYKLFGGTKIMQAHQGLQPQGVLTAPGFRW